MKRRIGIAVALATTAALILSACSTSTGTTTASGKPTKGGDLVIARSQDIIAMDKTSTFDNNSLRVMEQIMEPLFMVSADGKSLKPWLATKYTISSDQLTYTIDLRKGVKFSNGKPMTAADVKFSIDQNTASGSAGWGFINAAIDTVSVVDDSTVKIQLKHPWGPLIADLSLFANGIIPNNYGGKTAAQFYTAPVGTGPFVWDSWTKGQSVKLTRNPDYWQTGKPYLNRTVVPDANTRKLQLQGGQISIDDTPDWSSLASLKSTPGVNATTFPSTQMDYVAFNQKRAPFSDPHVRAAISYAIDREALVKAVLFGNGTPAYSMLSPGTPYYDKNAGGATYDVAKAKSELAQSTKPNGFTTSMLIASGDPNQASIAQIMQSELKAIGITMNIKQLDPTANKQARLAGDFDMSWNLWSMDIPDPDEWTSWAVDPTGGSNSAFTNYNNPAVIALNKQAAAETDQAKRTELYSELQKQTSKDAFLAYLFYSPYVFASTTGVQGFHVTPLGNYQLETVYLSK
ncbi:ABC transporter substrate-binding protein [Diaminobutyricibacter sp. McL0618]|uniref:ABC transporter substrate-binding protein n=1 Tax=Leifsonia sp. McL0618 TaxID=3415677 RepID=UPI003CE7E05C